jgi:hypothetical protein
MVCCQLTKATTGFPHPRGQTYQSTTVSNNNVDKNHAADSGSQATPPLPPQIEMSEWGGGTHCIYPAGNHRKSPSPPWGDYLLTDLIKLSCVRGGGGRRLKGGGGVLAAREWEEG